jgi:hypothetical protein
MIIFIIENSKSLFLFNKRNWPIIINISSFGALSLSTITHKQFNLLHCNQIQEIKSFAMHHTKTPDQKQKLYPGNITTWPCNHSTFDSTRALFWIQYTSPSSKRHLFSSTYPHLLYWFHRTILILLDMSTIYYASLS